MTYENENIIPKTRFTSVVKHLEVVYSLAATGSNSMVGKACLDPMASPAMVGGVVAPKKNACFDTISFDSVHLVACTTGTAAPS